MLKKICDSRRQQQGDAHVCDSDRSGFCRHCAIGRDLRSNFKRAELVRDKTGGDFPVYSSFEEMIAEAKPDVVLVTTIDSYHHYYIIKALEAGCDAITEKPMTIDEEKVNSILEVEKRTGKKR